MRTLKYFIAATVDGFIAHPDGTVDGFLMQGDHVADFLESLKTFDTVLMGRETYDFGRKLGVTNPYPTLEQFVFSKTLQGSPDPNVKLVSSDAATHVKALKARPGQDIWLCGGAKLAAALFAAGLIDEVIIKLNPVVFGSGKPLFSGAITQTSLQLTEHKVFDSGVAKLRYRVRN